MKKHFISFILLFIAAGSSSYCTEQRDSVAEILDKVIEKYQKSSSISYDVDYEFALPTYNHSYRASGACELFRPELDTMSFGFIHYSVDTAFEFYYDLENIYVVNTKTDTVFIKKPGRISPFAGFGHSGLTEIYFYKNEELKQWTSKTENRFILSEELLNNEPVWKILILPPPPDDKTKIKIELWINKNTYTLCKIISDCEFQEGKQYKECNLSNIKFNECDIDELNSRLDSIKQNFVLIDHRNISANKIELLPAGTQAPSFSGIMNDKETMFDFKSSGKLTLIEFWYTSCGPCINSIKHLNGFYSKYKGKGLSIYGLNSKNDRIKDNKNINIFLKRMEITYPIAFIDKSIDELFHVPGYPTIYLINQKGEIVHSVLGFSNKSIEALENKIREELEK